jgi:hypothetical protein
MIDTAELAEAEQHLRDDPGEDWVDGDYIHTVLDALTFYRTLAGTRLTEISRLNAELIEVRNGAEHNRIFGRHG